MISFPFELCSTAVAFYIQTLVCSRQEGDQSWSVTVGGNEGTAAAEICRPDAFAPARSEFT